VKNLGRLITKKILISKPARRLPPCFEILRFTLREMQLQEMFPGAQKLIRLKILLFQAWKLAEALQANNKAWFARILRMRTKTL